MIIGNPPYNANQQNENDKNREYPEIDRRISQTYIAASTAQKTKQYDMYNGSSAGPATAWTTTGLLGSLPTEPTWKRGRMTASDR